VRAHRSRLVSADDLVACFGESKARTEFYAIVKREYDNVLSQRVRGLRWLANGFEEIPAQLSAIRQVTVDGIPVYRA